MQFQEELYKIGLALAWRKQQDCNLRKIKIVEARCSDTGRQNILAAFSDKNKLTPYREISFSWCKKLYIERNSRK
jgi:hypothetical protein